MRPAYETFLRVPEAVTSVPLFPITQNPEPDFMRDHKCSITPTQFAHPFIHPATGVNYKEGSQL